MGSVRVIRRNIERNSSDKTSGGTRGNVGTKLRGIRPLSSVETASEAFINGWLHCDTSNKQVWIGIGTNDSKPSDVNAASGAAWGGMIGGYNGGLRGIYAGTLVNVRGADDMELSWANFSTISEWVGGSNPGSEGGSPGSGGYQSTAKESSGKGVPYFDFGSAGGCSSRCNDSYTWPQVYDLFAGFYDAVPMPEDYCTGYGLNYASVENHASEYKTASLTTSYRPKNIPWSTVMATPPPQNPGNCIYMTPQASWSDFTTDIQSSTPYPDYSIASTKITSM